MSAPVKWQLFGLCLNVLSPVYYPVVSCPGGGHDPLIGYQKAVEIRKTCLYVYHTCCYASLKVKSNMFQCGKYTYITNLVFVCESDYYKSQDYVYGILNYKVFGST